jgi:hypothetical protein
MTLTNGVCTSCELLTPCRQYVRAGREIACAGMRQTVRKPTGAQQSILDWVRAHGTASVREVEAGLGVTYRLSATLRRMADSGLLVASPGPGTSLMYAAQEASA